MTYEQALKYIVSLPRGKSKNGLEDMKQLMTALGNPQNQLKFIHIAGTNGKGSTNLMLANCLQEAGYRVGLNISPYIMRFNERIQINGEEIPNGDFVDLVTRIKPILESLQNQGVTLVQFEVVTAMALLYFYQQNCDIVCLEVGIGGLLDSTNIIQKSELDVICSISLDHTELLGESIEEIAYQKGGILKPRGRAVFYCDLNNRAKEVLSEIAEEKKVEVTIADKAQVVIEQENLEETHFTYQEISYVLHLIGKHQVYNALSVIESCAVLRQKGWPITTEQVQKGIEKTRNPARIELLGVAPTVLLDGGHNPEGVEALCDLVDKYSFVQKTAVVAMKRGKDVSASIKRLSKSFDKLVFTQFSWEISHKGEELLEIGRQFTKQATYVENVSEYINRDLKEAREKDVLFVFCGSLYFAGEVRPLLLEA